MTVREALMELWDMSGHSSDLYPFSSDDQTTADLDITAEGTLYFLRLLSQAQVALTNWKKRDQRFLRFEKFYINVNRQLGWDIATTYSISHTAASTFTIDPTQTGFGLTSAQLEASTIYINDTGYTLSDVTETSSTVWTCTTDVTVSGTSSYPATITGVYFGLVATRTSETTYTIDPTQTNFGLDAEEFSNSVMSISGSSYKVMVVTETSSTSWAFQLYPVPSETEDVSYSESITDIFLGLNEFLVESGTGTDAYSIQLPARVYQILRIDDYQSNTEVLKANNKEDLVTKGNASSTGTPAYYLNLGSRVIFDTALNEKRWYKLELFQQPVSLTALDDTFGIPEPFQQAILFWCQWKMSFRERQDAITTSNYRRILDAELMSVRDEYDNNFERSKTFNFKVRRS